MVEPLRPLWFQPYYLLTSKLILVPAATFCPGNGCCRTMISEAVEAAVPSAVAGAATICTLPKVNPARSKAFVASVSDLPTKLGITYRWALSAAERIRPILGEITSLALGDGSCATTVPGCAPGR